MEVQLKVAKEGKRKAEEEKLDLLSAIDKLKSEFSQTRFETLKSKAADIPRELLQSYEKKIRLNSQSPEYHPALRSFALTCHLYSPNAYR